MSQHSSEKKARRSRRAIVKNIDSMGSSDGMDRVTDASLAERGSVALDPNAIGDCGLNWPIVIWIVLVHVLALIAPFFFTVPALVTCIVLAFATGSLGVCMGYHRLLTHQSFKTYRPVRWMLAFLGGLSGEGSALTWVAQHRKHHAYSDHDGDPHSPMDGTTWSHLLWFMPDFGRKWHYELLKRYAPDIVKDKMMVLIHHMFLPSHFVTAVVLFLCGYFGPENWGLGSAWAGWSMVFWGLGVRMVYVLHVTWFVNSATHLWGYRNYETDDNSRNLWWVALLAFGEGWHNNHHAYQRVASQGHRWWEFDITYLFILSDGKDRPSLGRCASERRPPRGVAVFPLLAVSWYN